MRSLLLGLAMVAAGVATPFASAATITQGFTFAVASNSGAPATGTHFHSNTGGSFGNPAGKAEVGNFGGSNGEEVRGLSEYNLTGLTTGPAFVTFNVFKLGGLFPGTNDFPFTGNINVVAYQGNNTEDISDYQAASLGTVGTFNTSGLLVGSILSFDITSIYNGRINAASNSLGIRLQLAPGTITGGGALTFDTFRLTSTNDSTVSTPEPASLSMACIGAGVLMGYSWYRKRKSVA